MPAEPRFVRLEEIGKGNSGQVWKCRDTVLNRVVALKFLDMIDESELPAFRQEAHLAATLSHPNIATVHDVGEEGGRHFIVMQFIDGRRLDQVGPLGTRRVVAVVRDAARAVAYAHERGVVHCDIKPKNMMLTEGGHLYVTDFGLAFRLGSASGSLGGTPDYMSPAQLCGESPKPKDDIYSLGVTLLELLGKGRTPHSRRLSAIISRCLSGRYEKAADLAFDLDKLLARRRRWMAAAAAAALAIVGGGATAVVYRVERQAVESASRYIREAEALLANGDDLGAAAAFTKAIEIRPEVETYLDRGFCYYRAEEYEKAIADCDAAARLDPGNVIAARNRALASKYLKR